MDNKFNRKLDFFWVSIPQVEKLQVQVYYETKCPDSMSFLRNQLQPSMREKNRMQYTDLELIPFGKAIVSVEVLSLLGHIRLNRNHSKWSDCTRYVHWNEKFRNISQVVSRNLVTQKSGIECEFKIMNEILHWIDCVNVNWNMWYFALGTADSVVTYM